VDKKGGAIVAQRIIGDNVQFMCPVILTWMPFIYLFLSSYLQSQLAGFDREMHA
jgi:hypothetical protein